MKLLKRSSLFLISPVYARTSFCLYKHNVENGLSTNEAILKIKSDDLKFRVVSSNKQADKLELENYKFRSYPTDFNNNLITYSRWLDLGAIAFCNICGK